MRILIADDDPGSCKLTQVALEQCNYQLEVAENGNEAWQILQQKQIDIAVLDWIMPGISGLELCQRIRTMENRNYTYILMLTAKAEQTSVVAGLQAGADDYLVKPFDLDELRARINVGQRIVNLERSLVEANQKLEALVATDDLTGVMSRRTVFERLSEEVNRSSRGDSQLSIIMMNIDNFKEVNTHHGHNVGDLVIRESAQRVSNLLRPYDCIGRIGGDVFLLLLPGTIEPEAVEIGERIRGAIASRPFVSLTGTSVHITASLGVTTMLETFVPETLIAIADQELQRAKSNGGNQISAPRRAWVSVASSE